MINEQLLLLNITENQQNMCLNLHCDTFSILVEIMKFHLKVIYANM